MSKPIKIALIALFLVLVVFGAIGDMPAMQHWMGGLDLTLYVRLAALAGLIIACFTAWGYKSKMTVSHKFRRAQEVLSAAQSEAERKKNAVALLEEKLKSDFAGREKAYQEKIEGLKEEYNQRILALKEQNIQLKETASKLMGVLKKRGR